MKDKALERLYNDLNKKLEPSPICPQEFMFVMSKNFLDELLPEIEQALQRTTPQSERILEINVEQAKTILEVYKAYDQVVAQLNEIREAWKSSKTMTEFYDFVGAILERGEE